MKHSTARGGIAKTISRRSSVTSTATAPRPRPSWPTPCGFCWRAPPMSCTMRSARTCCPHRTGHRPTLHPDPHALQSGDSGQTVQGPHSPPPADVLPGQSALAPCHHPALCRPRPRVEHVLMRHPSPAERGCSQAHGSAHSTPRRHHRGWAIGCRNAPAGALCVHFRKPSPPGLQRRYPGVSTTTQKSPSVHLPRSSISPRMFRATVY